MLSDLKMGELLASLKTIASVIVWAMIHFGDGTDVFSNPVALHQLFKLDAQIAAGMRLVLKTNDINVIHMNAVRRY